MTKQYKKPKMVEETLENTVEETVEMVEEQKQAVEKTEKIAEKSAKDVVKPNEAKGAENVEEKQSKPEKQPKPEKQKSGGNGVGLLALLIALGVGGAGYFFGNQKFVEMDSQIQALSKKLAQVENTAPAAISAPAVSQPSVEIPSFDAEKEQIAQLAVVYQKAVERVEQLEKEQTAYTQQINSLQQKVQRLGVNPVAEPSAWLLSDADFLLNNALRKMVLDNDIETAKSLLIEADNTLSQSSDANAVKIRDAIKADLNQLNSVNEVDQNALMQRLASLANLVDNMPMAENEAEVKVDSQEVSDSLDDWQKNIEKSADSFLNHFIRINKKGNVVNDKAFIAPNQEIYLRENIRLRLQIAILAVPRQQNELYKQSLEAVGTWVRSYFDAKNSEVQQFLKELDALMEQSIYVDAPSKLQSLELLEKSLNKVSKSIEKVQVNETKPVEQPKVETQSNGKSVQTEVSQAAETQVVETEVEKVEESKPAEEVKATEADSPAKETTEEVKTEETSENAETGATQPAAQ